MLGTLIDPISRSALRVETFFGATRLATATGFTIVRGDKAFLVTNWHVVTGRDADSGECIDKLHAAVPDRLFVQFHDAGDRWRRVEISLVTEDGARTWLEHPQGRLVDVVAVPIDPSLAVTIYALDTALADTDMVVTLAMTVSVVGFPFGLATGGNWPIWKTGHVASDPDVDFQPGQPAFLIDATTRKGMSGAPVILRLTGGYGTRDGVWMINGPRTKFLGVYAGRIHEESEVGRVWRAFVLDEILQGKLLFNEQTRRTTPGRHENCPCGSGAKFKFCCGSITA